MLPDSEQQITTRNVAAQAINREAGQQPQTGPVSYADAVSRAAPSVVNIYTARTVKVRQGNSLLEQFFNQGRNLSRNKIQKGLGSGVIFSKHGYIVTNYHVVHQAEDIHVSLQDGRHAPAHAVGADPETDLAILKIELENLTPIPVGHSDSIRVGDIVLAIGNPFGVGQTVTMGIVSATGRDRLGVNTFENFIQTDAAINPGNSGGALINALGQLVGINSAIFSKSGGSDGIGFAIPVDMVSTVLEQIIQHGQVVRGWLGIEAREIPTHILQKLKTPGLLVTDVFQNGPADQAGLQRGDVITAINNQPTMDMRTMINMITAQPPGTKLAIEIMRDDRIQTLSATLQQRPLTST
ncbi:MAG: trypsin-like peptidase domain-containing protein [Gammaproteobacteria bacterium]|nr:trypsin-like peptidase domain-containing protein [Gammaproteobacteria bacterium]